ncbi:hypothetical protein CLV30_12586, partial [Haloactinopolyspora alba]
MPLTVEYLPDLARVRLTADTIPGSAALVERSIDELHWTQVRGGAPVTMDANAFQLDDYEFTPGVQNHYRVTPVTDPVVNLGMAGQVVTAGDTQWVGLDVTWPAQYIGGKMFRLTLTVDDVDRIGDISFYAGRHGDLSNHARWLFMADFSGSSTFGRSGQRFTIDLKAAEIRSVAGNVTMSADGELTELTA